MTVPLTSAMDNVIAWKLGEVARDAGRDRPDVGDSIDRGLILVRLLREAGFEVRERQAAAEGQGNERLLATVAELEVWNDAALKREDELRTQCASLVERVKELEARVAKRAAVTTATPTEPSKAAEGQGIWEARWQALKRGLRHRYDTEHVPARKAEQDSILAEMYAAELPQPDANCECDGGCWSTQGCYRQQANKLTATPTEPIPPDEVAK